MCYRDWHRWSSIKPFITFLLILSYACGDKLYLKSGKIIECEYYGLEDKMYQTKVKVILPEGYPYLVDIEQVLMISNNEGTPILSQQEIQALVTKDNKASQVMAGMTRGLVICCIVSISVAYIIAKFIEKFLKDLGMYSKQS